MWKAAIETLVASIGVIAVVSVATELLIRLSTIDIATIARERDTSDHCLAPTLLSARMRRLPRVPP
ncbi:hypothetical protein BH11PSE4_BH11PSE4_07330 [soil metagenome]